jgi:hypothetical protein
LEQGLATGHQEQRRLQQDQRAHALETVKSQLSSGAAPLVVGDVGAPHREVVEDCLGLAAWPATLARQVDVNRSGS